MTVNTLEVFLIVSDELCYEPLSSAGGGCGCCLIYNWTEEKKKEQNWAEYGLDRCGKGQKNEEEEEEEDCCIIYCIFVLWGLDSKCFVFFFTSIQQLSDEAKAQRKKKIFFLFPTSPVSLLFWNSFNFTEKWGIQGPVEKVNTLALALSWHV